jgi:hypothetical protein
MHRLGTTLLACLLTLGGLSGCGGNDPAPTERPTQQMRRSAAVNPEQYDPVVQQLYIAYFGRPADASGLANFKSQLAAIGYGADVRTVEAGYALNAELRKLVDSFGNSDESKALYPGDTAAFVEAIYVNLLNRAPDSEGKAFWVNAIDSGNLSRAKAAVSILAGALENKTPQGLIDAKVIVNKTDNSSVFTTLVPIGVYSGEYAAGQVRTMLSYVNADTTVAGFRATIDSTISKLSTPTGISVYAGNYSGTYTGHDQGTFNFTVGTDGTISGSGNSSTSGVSLLITGTLGNAGGTSVPLAGTIGPLNFNATLTSAGVLSGSWSGLGMSGTLSATRTTR